MRRSILALAVASMVGLPCAVQAGGVNYATAASQAFIRSSKLQAEAEIARLPVIYAWSVDAMDIDTLMTIFSDDIEYDLSAYGYPSVIGKAKVKAFFLSSVFPAETCSFITLSNMWSDVTGRNAIGGDYYVHLGINPRGLPAGTLQHTQGRHIYRFTKVHDEWKISFLKGELFLQWSENLSPVVPPPHGIGCPLPPGM
jgi:ketosteroid isomerase-like protein